MKYNDRRYIQHFAHHFLSSIYLSNIFHNIDIWCTYPSHTEGNSINKTLKGMIKVAAQESHKLYLDLFVRHTESRDSGKARSKGGTVDFQNQISTVHLNNDFKTNVSDKQILLIDDFITKGYSSECARNLLYKAGAKLVISVACGKYGDEYKKIWIKENFDPYSEINPDDLTFYEKSSSGKFHPDVDKQILNTL